MQWKYTIKIVIVNEEILNRKFSNYNKSWYFIHEILNPPVYFGVMKSRIDSRFSKVGREKGISKEFYLNKIPIGIIFGVWLIFDSFLASQRNPNTLSFV